MTDLVDYDSLESRTNSISEITKKLVAQYDAIHTSYFKELCMKHNIPYAENLDVMIMTLSQYGYEFILEKRTDSSAFGDKKYTLKLCKLIDSVKYIIKAPELKIGNDGKTET